MSILSDWQLRKHNATMYLMLLYRELREVLHSDLLLCEKEHLFTTTHRDKIRDTAWLVRPDLYLADRDKLTHPTSTKRFDHETGRERTTLDPDKRLHAYLDELDMVLDYTAKRAELLVALDEVYAVMALDLPIGAVNNQKTCNERVEPAKKVVPRLRAAAEALRLDSDSIGAPNGGYFWYYSNQLDWEQAMRRLGARA